MTGERVYETIVIGGGPAGATAARRLALAGRHTLLIDAARFPRPKACGGGLTGNVQRFLDFPIDSVVENAVTETLCMFRGRRTILLKPVGLNVAMVRRDLFDHLLVKKALEAGANLKDGTRVRRLERKNDRWRVETTKGAYESQTVIGADGAAGRTGEAAGLRREKRLGIALDCEVSVPRERFERFKRRAIFDFGIVPRGYGWSFPKGDRFSIGVGTTEKHFPEAREHLRLLIARHESLRGAKVLDTRGAPLPFWKGFEPLARQGVFLVGDAAGLVDPLSGEGISYAIRSGILAARFVDEKISGGANAEGGYTETVEKEISRGFAFALRLAEIFFTHPRLCYFIGVRSISVNNVFARLISGEIDYAQLYEELAASFPGRVYRALKPVLKRWKAA
ncbi:MAG: geranylgeranyl reductase family protein [Candidatus Hydrogenedentota bacterium]|nr:MAG: geranylgeranyl reductase family protein [Candidatus Hydrogenedentota bacterium]